MPNRKLVVTAKPIRLRLTPKCYELVAKIIGGPDGMLDRTVRVQLQSFHLNAIADWQPSGTGCLDLERLPDPHLTQAETTSPETTTGE